MQEAKEELKREISDKLIAINPFATMYLRRRDASGLPVQKFTHQKQHFPAGRSVPRFIAVNARFIGRLLRELVPFYVLPFRNPRYATLAFLSRNNAPRRRETTVVTIMNEQ